ncbi:hypothetical protein VTI74DRAFT_8343 [Chaetomium olivicolor]
MRLQPLLHGILLANRAPCKLLPRESGALDWSKCPSMPHRYCDVIDNCPDAGIRPTPCDCTQEMLNALYECPAELANCAGMTADVYKSGFQQLIAAWEKRCASALTTGSITTPTGIATATGFGGVCNNDNACFAGQTSLDECLSSARVGTTTDVNILTSCACQVPLLRTLSVCWFTDEPRCLGTPVNTSRIQDNYLVQMCPVAKTMFTFNQLAETTTATTGPRSGSSNTDLTITPQNFGPTETGRADNSGSGLKAPVYSLLAHQLISAGVTYLVTR